MAGLICLLSSSLCCPSVAPGSQADELLMWGCILQHRDGPDDPVLRPVGIEGNSEDLVDFIREEISEVEGMQYMKDIASWF